MELTRTRRDLLAAVGRGRVQLANGIISRRGGGDLNRRCDRDIRAFLEAGLVELGPDNGTYRLTAAGQAVLGVPS